MQSHSLPSAITAASPSRARVLGTLTLGVLAVSCAAIFIRYAQLAGAPSLTIAAGRLVIASLIVVPLALITCGAELKVLSGKNFWRGSLVGLMLALHFWAWIASLNYISVALSTVLVTTTPIWVALGAWMIRGERLSTKQVLGLLFAVMGSAALALTSGNVRGGDHFFLGALLALAGAWAIAANLLIGQGLRAGLSVRAYAALAYGWAAVWLLIALLVTATPLFGLSPRVYLFIAALALIPQVIGHTALNWALPFLGATTVAVSVLGEPIGAAVIATWLLNEPITPVMVVCFALTLVGIVLVAQGDRTKE